MTLRLCVLASAVVMLSASCGFMDPPTPSKDKDEAIPFRIGLTEWGEICNFDNQAHDGDLSFMMDKILNSDARGGLYNLDFRDDQLDRLREEFKNEYREDALRVKKLEIQSKLKEVCPIIPLYYDYGFAAVGPRFSGDETLVAALAKDPGSMTHLHEYR